MNEGLVLDCGAAETRAARLVRGEAVEFWFGPALGDETLSRAPEFGDLCAGKMGKVAPGLRGAFVDIGADRDAFLTLGDGDGAPPEGARLVVKVRRPPLSQKGAVVTLDWRAGASAGEQAAIEKLAADAAPGVLNNAGVAVRALRAFAGKSFDRIATNSPEAAAALRRAETVVRDDLDLSADIGDAVEAALERTADLDGGAKLVVDEMEGGAFVDVDGGAAADTGAGAAARVNAAAASILFRELSRRGIGGRIVVDFLPVGNRPARDAFLKALTGGPKDGYECRLGELSVDGLLDLTAPRRRLSLLEQASEPDETAPRPGRRFTLDWSAKAALRKLETGLKRQPKARPRLFVGSEIAEYLANERRHWKERLQRRYGARFAIEAQEKLKERAFDLAE